MSVARTCLLDGVCRVRNSHGNSFVSHGNVCNTKNLERIKPEGERNNLRRSLFIGLTGSSVRSKCIL